MVTIWELKTEPFIKSIHWFHSRGYLVFQLIFFYVTCSYTLNNHFIFQHYSIIQLHSTWFGTHLHRWSVIIDFISPTHIMVFGCSGLTFRKLLISTLYSLISWNRIYTVMDKLTNARYSQAWASEWEESTPMDGIKCLIQNFQITS